MDMQLVLEGVTNMRLRWRLLENSISFEDIDSINDSQMLGSATATLTSIAPVTSTLSIPLADVFSNPTVSATDGQLRTTSIQLCPGS